MQKNKIDVMKAVCNSAVKRLAVLSLAATVSCGAVACAQMSEDEANRQLQRLQVPERMNEETLQERLRRLEREREEVGQQLEKVDAELYLGLKRIEEIQQQSSEKYDQALKMQAQELECRKKGISVRVRSKALYTEARTLRKEAEASRLMINPLKLQERALTSQFEELTAQIADLQAQIAAEQQEELVEEIVEIVPEDDEMKEEAEEQRENQNETTEANIPQDAFRNMLRLHMPNQRQGTRGGMFNMMRPFGSKK